jgi:DNA-binding LacI/PurR family transcriptional regulator
MLRGGVRVQAKRRIGIRDVAAAADVSLTTVSHALNGKGRLTEDTRRRVQEVARELGYSPSATARNLVVGKTGILGLAVSTTEGIPFALSDFAYFVQLMSAATAAALECGFALVLAGPTSDERPFARVELDGAIVVDPVTRDPVVHELRQRDVPVVTTGRVPEGEDGFWVDNDHVAGTRRILDHLARQGARRVGLIASPPVTSYARDARDAYDGWCAERGCEPLVAVAGGDLGEGAGFTAALALLDLPDPPDAIYATLDRLALGALLAARARHVSVPDDLLVAGCTDSDAGRWARPSLTALALNPHEIGRQAVAMLIALAEGLSPEPPHRLVPTRVLVRGSTQRRGSGASAGGESARPRRRA